jgi:outer membrane lipoprotein SlyB
MSKQNRIIISTLIGSAILSGCAAPGQNLQANVYRAGQVNQVQEAKTVVIKAVMPAQVEVDNSAAKKQAEIGGAVIGALLGGAIGNRSKRQGSGTVGAVGGAAAGAAAGSMVGDKILVDGVSLTYVLNNRMLTSTQVGKLCEFKAGEVALMISTSPTETRIQPNAECPVKK